MESKSELVSKAATSKRLKLAGALAGPREAPSVAPL